MCMYITPVGGMWAGVEGGSGGKRGRWPPFPPGIREIRAFMFISKVRAFMIISKIRAFMFISKVRAFMISNITPVGGMWAGVEGGSGGKRER